MAKDTSKLFDQIAAIRSVTSMALHKIAFNEKEYESVIELIIDVLRSLGITEEAIIREIIGFVAGSGFAQKLESGKTNFEKAVYDVVNDWDESNVSGWLIGLEDAVKYTIANILTSILSCSVNPFLPLYAMDNVTGMRDNYGNGILIPESILNFSGTLNVAPLGMTGQYFYDITPKSNYYKKISGSITKEIISGSVVTYSYRIANKSETQYLTEKDSGSFYLGSTDPTSLSPDDEADKYLYDIMPPISVENKLKLKAWCKDRLITLSSSNIVENCKACLSSSTDYYVEYYVLRANRVPNKIEKEYSGYTYQIIENPTSDEVSESAVYTELPEFLEGEEGENAPNIIRLEKPILPGTLYKTKDFNAFIWNAINQGKTDPQIEYNKMMWDSRRRDTKKNGTDVRNTTNKGWSDWLQSKNGPDGEFVSNPESKTLFPVLQLENYTGYPEDTCLKVAFPAQRYNPDGKRKTIYQFNKDYLESINIFCPKVIIMNMVMELTKISLFPEVTARVSINKQKIDAKLSNMIVKLLTVDDLNVSDCYFSFSNVELNQMLRDADLRQFNAKAMNSESDKAIQYSQETIMNAYENISNGASLNEDTNSITTTIYDIANAGATTKEQIVTSLGFDLSVRSNFISDVIYAIIMPLVRAVFSPQIMLLFMINFEVMGLIDLSNLGDDKTFDKLMSLVMRKLVGAVVTIVKQIKDAIATILYRLLEKELKPLLDELQLMLILEELDAWLLLLKQALGIFRNSDETSIDDVNYADITKVQNIPDKEKGEC